MSLIQNCSWDDKKSETRKDRRLWSWAQVRALKNDVCLLLLWFLLLFFEQGLTYPGRSWTQHMTMCILRKALCLYSHTPIPGRFWVVAFSRSLRDEWAPSGWGRETQVPGAWGGAMTGMSNWRTSTGKWQALTRSQQVNMELASPAFLLPCHPVMSRKKK